MPNNEVAEMLEMLFRQAKMQFGNAIKSRWIHDGDGCPGCGRAIDAVKIKKKKKAISLNTFIFREHGVLIAYFLCGKCATYIIQESKRNPYTTTPLHFEIEKNLKQAFIKHLGH